MCMVAKDAITCSNPNNYFSEIVMSLLKNELVDGNDENLNLKLLPGRGVIP